MKTLIHSYLSFFKKIPRFFYWQYRWLKADTGSNGKLVLPLKLEGYGKLRIGDNFELGENVLLGIGNAAQFETGKRLHIERNVEMRLGKDSSITAGDDFRIGQGSRIFVNSHWQVGEGVVISPGCQLSAREPNTHGKLKIGNQSEIGDNTMIDTSDDVSIGNDVSIGPNCIVYTHNHIYNEKDLPAWKAGIRTAPVVISDGAWITAGVIILPGVTIGKRAVIAAGAVVTQNLEGEAVYGGVPAKLIKKIG